MQMDKGVNMCIIQVYTPIAGAEEEEVEHFNKELDEVVQKQKEYYTILMGDFNAKVGKESLPTKR